MLAVLVSHHADLNKANNDGWCPIHGASVHGHVEEVKYLIGQGVDVNVCEKRHHHTPLMMCILSREFNLEVEKLLLGAGADWTIMSKSGNTALHACTVRDNVEAAQILVDFPKLKPPMNLKVLNKGKQSVLQLCRTNCARKMSDFMSDRLGHRRTVIMSPSRPSQTLSVPASPPKPTVSEAPGETPRMNRRSLEEQKPPSPHTPPRPKSQEVEGNKTHTTSERKNQHTPK